MVRRYRSSLILSMSILTSFIHLNVFGKAGKQGDQRISLVAHSTNLGEIIREIKRQTGLTFFYSSPEINKVSDVTVSLSDVKLDQAFERLFLPNGIGWKYVDDIVVLSSAGREQGKKIVSINVEKVGLKEVFKIIEHQTGFEFFYNTGIIRPNDHISLKAVERPLDEVLGKILTVRGLGWEYFDNMIKVGPVTTITAGKDSSINSISVTGKITDMNNNPVVGATIMVKGTKEGASTNETGEFTLPNVTKKDVLSISSIGYEAREIPVKGSSISIKLNLDIKKLNEVAIVSTGYQKIPKERSTGSFAFMDNQLFNKRVSPDVMSRLEGNIPGLIFNRNTAKSRSGEFDINIRGQGTLFSNNQPLIVVDNFAYDGDITNINPNDIESITILKDAAAASIWGVRSGNGVIVITTKRGHRGQKMRAEFNANITFGGKPDLYYSRDFMNSHEYIDIEQQLFTSGYYDSQFSDPAALVSPAVQIMQNQRIGKISPAEAESQLSLLRTQDVRRDLLKYFYRNSVNQQYSANVSGGGEKSTYYLSLGYDNLLYNTVGNKANRFTLNSDYSFFPIRNLTFTVGVNFVQNNSTNNSPLGTFPELPYLRLADQNGNPLAIQNDYNNSFKDSLTNLGLLDWKWRPLQEIGLADNSSNSLDNRLNFGIRYNLLHGFNFEVKYQYQRLNTLATQYNSLQTYSTRNLINTFTQMDPDGNLTYPVPMGGILLTSEGTRKSHQVRTQLGYENTFAGKHALTAIAGFEIRHASLETSSNIAYGYDKSIRSSISTIDYNTYFPTLPYGSTQRIQSVNGFGKTTDNFLSYFGNAAYTYNNLYTLSLSGRIDQTNFFGLNTNQKAVPLYSFGLAWNLSKESFYNVKWLPNLKPRFTFGYNGNINSSVTAVTTISRELSAPYSGLPYTVITNPGNPELRWERHRMINIGVDFGLINDRITGSVEYYSKHGIDLLGTSPLAPSTGYLSFLGNTANTKGHGLDIVINSLNLTFPKFKWQSTIQFSTVSDKVTKYDVKATVTDYIRNGDPAGDVVPLVGSPIFGIYSYRWAGLDPETGDPQGYVGDKVSKDYNAILNNNSFDSLYYNGPAQPRTFGSFRNTFTYGPFSLSFNIIYKFNYFFRRQSISSANSIANMSSGNIDYEARWRKPGDELSTQVPSLMLPPFDDSRSIFYNYSSALVTKGDHIRLQDITINYNFAGKANSNSPFNNFSLYGYISNIGIIWRANKFGLDPDLYGASAFPSPRSYAIGFKANF